MPFVVSGIKDYLCLVLLKCCNRFLGTLMGIDVEAQPDKGGQYLNSLAKYVIKVSKFKFPHMKQK